MPGEQPRPRAIQCEHTNKLKNEDVRYKSSIRIDGEVQRGHDILGLSDDIPRLKNTSERDDPDDTVFSWNCFAGYFFTRACRKPGER